MTAAQIAAALGGARRSGAWWRCVCPVHGSRTGRSLSLALRDHPRGLTVHCHAGCSRNDVIAELRRMGLLAGHSEGARAALVMRRSNDTGAARRTALAQRIWDTARDARGSPVECYLRNRGITIPPPLSLRWVASCKHGPSKTYLSALVGKVVNVNDELVAIHRIYLLPDGTGKAAVDPEFHKMSLGPTAGAAVRLSPFHPDRALIVGEGIENTLSLMQLRGLPGWSAIGTSGLKSLVLPQGARRVLIAVDHDPHGKGEAAAREGSGRWLVEGREVRLAIPAASGDWNDVLKDSCRA